MASVNNGTRLIKCDCKDEYQDKSYGKGIRVHNLGGNKVTVTAKCTNCGKKVNTTKK